MTVREGIPWGQGRRPHRRAAHMPHNSRVSTSPCTPFPRVRLSRCPLATLSPVQYLPKPHRCCTAQPVSRPHAARPTDALPYITPTFPAAPQLGQLLDSARAIGVRPGLRSPAAGGQRAGAGTQVGGGVDWSMGHGMCVGGVTAGRQYVVGMHCTLPAGHGSHRRATTGRGTGNGTQRREYNKVL